MALRLELTFDLKEIIASTPAGTSTKVSLDVGGLRLLHKMLLAQERQREEREDKQGGIGALERREATRLLEEFLAKGGTVTKVGPSAKRAVQELTLEELGL